MYRGSEVAYLYSSAVSAELDVVDGRVLALDGFQLLARPEVVGGPVPEVAIALTFVALFINPTPYSLSLFNVSFQLRSRYVGFGA